MRTIARLATIAALSVVVVGLTTLAVICMIAAGERLWGW